MKRIVSLMLCFALMISIVPTAFTVFADETDPAADGQIDASTQNDELTPEATSSFGELLANDIIEQQETGQGCYGITGAELYYGNEVDVSYFAPMGCPQFKLMAAVYDEETDELITSASKMMDGYSSVATIAFDKSVMPEFFVLRVFMLSGFNTPLCEKYETKKFTQGISEVENATVNDFEDDKVINFDDDDTTNFVVLNEETRAITAAEGENIPEDTFPDDNVYVFHNANEQLKSLKKGDKAVYVYGMDLLLIKVESIEIDGDNVIINSSDEIALDDFFDMLKLDSGMDVTDTDMDFTNADPRVTYNGIVPTDYSVFPEPEIPPIIDDPIKYTCIDNPSGDIGDVDVNASLSNSYSFNIIGTSGKYEITTNDSPNTTEIEASLSITVGISFNGSISIYYNFFHPIKTYDIEFGLDIVTTVTGSASGSFTESIQLPSFAVPTSVPGLFMGFDPEFVFKGTITTTVTAGITKHVGLEFSEGSSCNTSTNPVFSVGVKVEGVIEVGIDLGPGVVYAKEEVLQAKFEIFIGIDITARMASDLVQFDVGENAGNTETSADKHLCKICYSGDISFVFTLGASLKVFNRDNLSTKITLVPKISIPICKYYYSPTFDDAGMTTCPHYGKPDSDSDSDKSSDSDSDKGSDTDGGPTDTDKDPNVVDGGGCTEYNGGSVSWTLYTDGTLEIDGEGWMKDFWRRDSRGIRRPMEAPWEEYRSMIEKVVIKGRVKNVGAYSMQNCVNLTKVEFELDDVVEKGPGRYDGLIEICEGAFNGCTSLKKIELPDTVMFIDFMAFGYCTSLSEVKMPSKLYSLSGFNDCTSLNSAYIPYGTRYIDDYAFDDSGISGTVTIPDTVYQVGWRAFANTNITSVEIPSKFRPCYDIFDGCSYLKTVKYPNTKDDFFNNVIFELGLFGISTTNLTWNFDRFGEQFKLNDCHARIVCDPDNPYVKPTSYYPSGAAQLVTVSKDYSGLIEGNEYLYAAVRTMETDDIFSNDNLIHIGQVRADENGEATVSFPMNSGEEYELVLFGPKKPIERTISEMVDELKTEWQNIANEPYETPDEPDDTDSDAETPDEPEDSDSDTATDSATDTETADVPDDTDSSAETDTAADSDVPDDSDETDSDGSSDTSTDESSDTDSGTSMETTDIPSDTDSDENSDTDTGTDTETESDTDTDSSDITDTDENTDEPDNSDTDENTPDTPEDTDSDSSEPIGLLGDIDGDGVVTASDALFVLRASLGLETLDEDQTVLADVNHDSIVDSADALEIMRFTVGLSQNEAIAKDVLKTA